MGLGDRDYMHEQGFSARGWYAGLSVGGKLILANIVVFVVWQLSGFPRATAFAEFMAGNFMVDWEAVRHGRVWTLVTSGFSHIELFHLLFNLLFLWVFIPDLERIYGRRNVLALYLLGAAGCSAAHLGLTAALGGLDVPMLGASGAVMAVVVVSALLFPHRRINIWGVLPVPLWALALVFILLDLSGVASTARGADSPVANAGHLGGALAGFLFKTFDLRFFSDGAGDLGPGAFARLREAFRRRRRPKLRVLPPVDPATGKDDGVRTIDADTAARVDELLRKINRDGLGSLSEDERQFLQQASSKYKR